MVLQDEFSPVSSAILQTIQSSEFHFMFPMLRPVYRTSRCLIFGIQYFTEYLCATCIRKKRMVHNLGTIRDMNARLNSLRVDSVTQQRKVEDARRLIFEHKTAPDAPRICGLLGEGNVPIRVRSISLHILCINYLSIECFFSKAA
jgi:hypothetical protein